MVWRQQWWSGWTTVLLNVSLASLGLAHSVSAEHAVKLMGEVNRTNEFICGLVEAFESRVLELGSFAL